MTLAEVAVSRSTSPEDSAIVRLPTITAEATARFAGAEPFPHAVFDDTLMLPSESVLASFPDERWQSWRRYRDEYQRGKLICSDVTRMSPLLQRLVAECSAPPFLDALAALTGVGQLIPDPYLEGGGLHATLAGGTLAPHTDFHVYTRLGLYRRLNVLVYLNPEWTDADGGALQLFATGSGAPSVEIAPVFGRLVVFRTDDRSPHGFTTPVAAGRVRRSLAFYYYTATESAEFAGDTNTYWLDHGAAGRMRRRVRLAAYRALLTGSRACSFAAHRCNPNLGSRVRPD
jgi:hypothetical protein